MDEKYQKEQLSAAIAYISEAICQLEKALEIFDDDISDYAGLITNNRLEELRSSKAFIEGLYDLRFT